jgi:hypothetical protein
MAHVHGLGIDIVKQMFHVVGMDNNGTIMLRKRIPRGALMSCIAQMPPVVIGMEACGVPTTGQGASAIVGLP